MSRALALRGRHIDIGQGDDEFCGFLADETPQVIDLRPVEYAAETYQGPMYLENIVFDAVEPRLLGRFWEAVVGGEQLTDEPGGFETRLTIEGGPVIDRAFSAFRSRQSSR